MKETTKDDVIARLKTVEDPEMHVDVYSLGLIYDINITAEKIYILMTLTTPFCPYSKQIKNQLHMYSVILTFQLKSKQPLNQNGYRRKI